jgi:hypothetical protein
MTTIILPKTHHVRLGAVTERLKERLAEIKIAHRTKVDAGSSWEKGFDEALAAEIHFLTGLLDALEKS